MQDAEIHLLRNLGADGLSADPEGLRTGGSSGYMALNLAVLAGAKRIVLLGYDCRPVGGKNHFFGDHPDKSTQPFDHWRKMYRRVRPALDAAGVEVLNATPESGINAFRRIALEDVVHDPAGAALSA